jgi:hypothetical protein
MIARLEVSIALLLLAVGFMSLAGCGDPGKPDAPEKYLFLLREEFDGAAFPPTGWTAYGPGVSVQDSAQGVLAPSFRLNAGGVLSGLRSPTGYDAQARHFAVKIAIDPTPGSGAQARFVLRNPSSGTVVASVTVTEGLITYVMGSGTPVILAWVTDGAFHDYEFQGFGGTSTGGHWWLRDLGAAASSTTFMTAAGLSIELESTGTGAVWFDDVRVYSYLGRPA